MSALPIREKIVSELEKLSERELEAVLRYVEVMQSIRLPDDYDENHDPSVGFFSAEPDFARRSREILADGFGQPPQNDDRDKA